MEKYLVVAEKPSVARDLAEYLGCNKKCNGYYDSDGQYTVTNCVGHLIGLKLPNEYSEQYSKWSYETLPIKYPLKTNIHESMKILENTKSQFAVVQSLINSGRFSAIIFAGDAGREGILLQFLVYEYAKNKLPVKILWISSFTKSAVLEGFTKLHDSTEPAFVNLLAEAKARQLLDWELGMNISRAMSLNQTSKEKVGYGRCQSPTLAFITKRQREIESFKPEPYYNAQVTFEALEGSYKGILIDDKKNSIKLAEKDKCESFVKALRGHKAQVVASQNANKSKNAPLLFDLTSLQIDCSKKFGYDAQKTLDLAQSLYETRKLLTYPRTDSRYLTSDLVPILHRNLKAVSFGEYLPFTNEINEKGYQINTKIYVNDKKVTDHPGLCPTDNPKFAEVYKTLPEDEKNVMDLVIKKFISIYFPPFLYQASEIITAVEGRYFFKTRGRVPLDFGYRKIFDDSADDKKDEDESADMLPKVMKGEEVSIPEEGQVLEKKTKAPKKPSVDVILAWMNSNSIGTPATRAGIIEALVSKEYILLDKKNYKVTELGSLVSDATADELKSPEFTAKMEEDLALIGEGKLDKDAFLNGKLDLIEKYIEYYKHNKIDTLTSAAKKAMIHCPCCDNGLIKDFKSKSGDIYYVCSNKTKENPKCLMFFSNKIAGRVFTKSEVKSICHSIIKNSQSEQYDGFVGKKGLFSCRLKLNEEGTSFTFDFTNCEKRQTTA